MEAAKVKVADITNTENLAKQYAGAKRHKIG
jgi:hypothetical protein